MDSARTNARRKAPPGPLRRGLLIAAGFLAAALGAPPGGNAAGAPPAEVRRIVDEAMKPLLAEHGIPGLAVAVTIDGERHFLEYGVAARDPRVPVTRDTLFELGSVSKTFAATLAALGEVEGRLSLEDGVALHLPELKGSALDRVRLLDLATHTAGGFPLQFPDGVGTNAQIMDYFRAWKPRFPPGTQRTYANPSIGLLGVATARAMGAGFVDLMERRLFPALGLERTYIRVPAAEAGSYAWGYNRDGRPVRVNPGPLADEAYGVKSNAVDMLRFLEANMGVGAVPGDVAGALQATHAGRFRSGEVVQALVWERYPWPVAVERMVAGNGPAMALEPHPATAIEPPQASSDGAIFNKTGSTGGFGAYVAFIPAEKIGIVMLANRFYPNAARVRAAHSVLSQLAE